MSRYLARYRTQRYGNGRFLRDAYIPDVRLQADAPDRAERRLASQVFERPVSTQAPDSFDRLALEWGLRVSLERLTIAPRDVAAPPDEAESCFLVTITGPE